jgi:transcriptional regulator with XRE-family HTH domain
MNDRVSDDLKTRVCWLYYVEGMTQDEVAGLVGLTRSKVLRILANSRADGTVQIRVSSKISDCVELERKIEAQFGLERAIVIPSPQKRNVSTTLRQWPLKFRLGFFSCLWWVDPDRGWDLRLFWGLVYEAFRRGEARGI